MPMERAEVASTENEPADEEAERGEAEGEENRNADQSYPESADVRVAPMDTADIAAAP